MPQMGVSVSEGTITKWLKEQGDQVEADEPLLEISTDKVDTEVPSPGSGVLTEILVGEGQTVDVGTKLAVIGGEATEPTSGSEPQSREALPGPPPARPGPPPPPATGGPALSPPRPRLGRPPRPRPRSGAKASSR